MKTFKTKIKSYSFWTGLSGAVVMLCTTIGKCFGWTINDKLIEEIIMSVCGVLVVLGVVCMPIKTEDTQTNNESLTDDVEQTSVENNTKQKDTENKNLEE